MAVYTWYDDKEYHYIRIGNATDAKDHGIALPGRFKTKEAAEKKLLKLAKKLGLENLD